MLISPRMPENNQDCGRICFISLVLININWIGGKTKVNQPPNSKSRTADRQFVWLFAQEQPGERVCEHCIESVFSLIYRGLGHHRGLNLQPVQQTPGVTETHPIDTRRAAGASGGDSWRLAVCIRQMVLLQLCVWWHGDGTGVSAWLLLVKTLSGYTSSCN